MGRGRGAPRPLVVVLVAAAALTGCGGSKCGPSSATVTTVVDGDTFEAETDDGQTIKVRLLLVDAPEITSGKNDCYGQQAASYTGAFLGGARVELAYDEAACTDRFERLLAYVKVGADELNTALVKQGLACTLFIAPGGTARADEFATYESEARTDRTGMWGACATIPCSN